MNEPFTTIIWINHNSRKIIETVIKAIEALTKLNFTNYEIIIVENGSTDGSDKIIEEYLKGLDRELSSRIKYIKLEKNYGFTGAIYYAYKARDFRAKYCMLVNTDMIIEPEAIKQAINFLELNKHVGAVQGIILRLTSEYDEIDSAGMMIDEFLNRIKLFRGQEISDVLEKIDKPQYVSFVEGTGPIYRIEAVEKCHQRNDILYIPQAFIWYLEDMYLGLLMWSKGYASVLLPIIFGKHYREYSIKRMKKELLYVQLRNDVAINLLCRNRTYPFRVLRIFLTLLKCMVSGKKDKVRAILSGINLFLKIKSSFGSINLDNAPQIKCTSLISNGFKTCFQLRGKITTP
jgi:GT2 family glycosyltransferase